MLNDHSNSVCACIRVRGCWVMKGRSEAAWLSKNVICYHQRGHSPCPHLPAVKNCSFCSRQFFTISHIITVQSVKTKYIRFIQILMHNLILDKLNICFLFLFQQITKTYLNFSCIYKQILILKGILSILDLEPSVDPVGWEAALTLNRSPPHCRADI